MGIWGYPVFANDHAMDCVDSLMRQFTQTIEKTFADPRLFAQEIAGQGDILPSLALLNKLSVGEDDQLHYPRSITAEALQAWQDRYLVAYDHAVRTARRGGLPAYNTGMSDRTYQKRRRIEIIRVFDEALRLVAERDAPPLQRTSL